MTIPDSTCESGFASDSDATETQEWLDALDGVLRSCGPKRCKELLRKLRESAHNHGVDLDSTLNTPYCNTISLSDESAYPGNPELERRITASVRWNALAMVVRANRRGELGGHLSTYASIADLVEVGFNHFFRGDDGAPAHERTGDLVFFQAHSAPGIYARAFVEGRLTEDRLANFRREVAGKGLCSYPHPWLMPDFWEFPTASMGLGAMTTVYQARFMRYLSNHGLTSTAKRRVWAFVGDGEMDEPESTVGLSIAARERLDNLILVVNCNLQRLDGPVRGNGGSAQLMDSLSSHSAPGLAGAR
jgi:pyruvate dehydrogenase E1 component